jgi:hypothetical protein
MLFGWRKRPRQTVQPVPYYHDNSSATKCTHTTQRLATATTHNQATRLGGCPGNMYGLSLVHWLSPATMQHCPSKLCCDSAQCIAYKTARRPSDLLAHFIGWDLSHTSLGGTWVRRLLAYAASTQDMCWTASMATQTSGCVTLAAPGHVLQK